LAWTDVPLPKKMRGLEKDARGYPIPFNVLRDTDGKAHFAITDDRRQDRCLKEGRCPICGDKLNKIKWLVGGPLSAFHEYGAYFDTALHYECMAYALQVCPYLSMPTYLGRVDDKTLDKSKAPEGMNMFLDITMIPERPAVFVAVATSEQIIVAPDIIRPKVRPKKPYLAVEFWKDGKRISLQEAEPLLKIEIPKEVKAL
jgi:hypothetical protein